MENQRTRNSSTYSNSRRKDIPDGIWIKCVECGEIIYNGELSRNLRICPRCDYYFPLEPAERIALLTDKASLVGYDTDDADSLDEEVRNWAIITGEAKISRHHLVIAAINLNFSNEDIGLFVCKKIVKAVDRAIDQHLPLLLVYSNGVGLQSGNDVFLPARTLSTNAALSRLARQKLLYISVLEQSNSHCHFPGFAYTADIVIAESNVKESPHTGSQIDQSQTSQMANSLFQNGMVDIIVSRRQVKQTLADILNILC
jgi:acetyl-CoA carboxylase carboxyl transferase subunit beta